MSPELADEFFTTSASWEAQQLPYREFKKSPVLTVSDYSLNEIALEYQGLSFVWR